MRRIVPVPLALVALFMVFGVSPMPAAARQAAGAATSTRYQVTVVRLKADRVNEWLDLQKNEVVPALKKAGMKERQVWATAVGNTYEYTILVPFEKWALMDGPNPVVTALGAEGAARLAAKTRACVDTQRTFMTNRADDINIAPGNALVMRTVVRRVQPGKLQDYMAFLRADIAPALRKAKADGKIAGATFAIRGAGAQAGEVTTTEYFNKFADLDSGNIVAAVVGQEAMAKINAKGAPLATTVQTVIRRRVADASF